MCSRGVKVELLVLKLSFMTDLAPQTSLASESVEPHDLSKCFSINTRSLQGDKDARRLDSPSRVNVSGHGHFSQSTISHQAAIFSNNILQGPRPVSLLHIPLELVTRILLYLTPHDIISCRRTCRMFHDLCSCPSLRYLVQMERCAMSDEMRSGLSYPERLRILENREEAWATLDFRRTVQVSVPFHSTGTYDLTGGAFLLGTRPFCADHLSTVGYSYLSLPSLSEDKEVEWRGFNIGIPILDVGLAVHEHDLIGVLTACVFLTFLIDQSCDFKKGNWTWVNHQINTRPWKCGYRAFPQASLIPLLSNP